MAKKVLVRELVRRFQLEIICGEDQLHREITVSDLHRPGLELAGFFTYHPVERIQLLGRTELSFIASLSKELRKERFERLCHPDIPCICVTRGLPVPDELIEAANAKKVPILRTSMVTTPFSSKVTNYLEKRLAPSTTVHGVLVDVYGIGVLIMGDSGIGKSETALELVKRGHRLVADDAVEIIQTEGTLIGSAPELIKNLLEIRGLGIINVMTLFGAGAVCHKKTINMVIRLENWQENRQYDRLGLDEERVRIIDVDLPLITIPVRPGRNLAVIVEVAAMNWRLKQMGHNAAQQFVQRLGEAIEEVEDED